MAKTTTKSKTKKTKQPDELADVLESGDSADAEGAAADGIKLGQFGPLYPDDLREFAA